MIRVYCRKFSSAPDLFHERIRDAKKKVANYETYDKFILEENRVQLLHYIEKAETGIVQQIIFSNRSKKQSKMSKKMDKEEHSINSSGDSDSNNEQQFIDKQID